ncbi:ribonuclease H-like domain-containing protein [Favolaschia claudopus]|uniref:Ribonuclease H-like domain-containing protein n=1 Tax=Favolaschia claudopus TaxID=2862362 RepID=A0AAW0CS61_9AGAR
MLDLFQKKVDLIIVRLICVRGLVPNLLDSDEWKELMGLLNPNYHPTGATVFTQKLIPQEAVFVREKQIKLLRECDNLVLTFDGTSTRNPASIYTAHATTPDRRSFFLDGHTGSDERHTADWIVTKLLKTIRSVGENKWAATCSDSTNVTKASRRGVNEAIPTIQDLGDCVHAIHNTIGDVNKVAEFVPHIATEKVIVSHFNKSSISTSNLAKTINEDTGEKILKLQKVGGTRFGTHWSAGAALDPALPNIRQLVENKIVKFKNKKVQAMFLNRQEYQKFELSLLDYLTIVGPFIRALWSLEAANANASDVFIFWLAIAANLKDTFDNRTLTGIPLALATKITKIFNERYTEFFKNEVYFVTFALDPRYPCADFFKPDDSQPSESDSDSPRFAHAYDRVKKFLKSLLKSMIDRISTHPDEPVHPVIEDLGPVATAKAFRNQFDSFWRQEWPFNQGISDGDPLKWWKSLALHPQANVLAILGIKLFSMLVNSMPDERTNSHLTWFNSPLRGNQKPETLIDMIQIGQWYGKHTKSEASVKKEPYRPVVKFRNIDKKLLETVRSRRAVSSESDSESDDEDTEIRPEDETPVTAQPASRRPPPVFIFDIDPDLNIAAPALLDLLSVDGPVQTTAAKESQAQMVRGAKTNPADIDWDSV